MGIRRAAVFVMFATVLHMAGCGGSETAPTSKVSGTVTLDGEPVADASVGFVPENGRPASGVTDESGRFTLTTFEPGDGAVLGKHQVVITPHIPDEVAQDSSPEGMAKLAETEKRFPAKYGDKRKSGFEVEVKDGEPNEFTFDMVSN